jgi:hypothetical protein
MKYFVVTLVAPTTKACQPGIIMQHSPPTLASHLLLPPPPPLSCPSKGTMSRDFDSSQGGAYWFSALISLSLYRTYHRVGDTYLNHVCVSETSVCNQKNSRGRLERGGPCWLLKLEWMETQRVQVNEILPCLVHWACRAGTRDFFSALAPLVDKIFFPYRVHYFNSLSQSPSKLAGSRAESPVS